MSASSDAPRPISIPAPAASVSAVPAVARPLFRDEVSPDAALAKLREAFRTFSMTDDHRNLLKINWRITNVINGELERRKDGKCSALCKNMTDDELRAALLAIPADSDPAETLAPTEPLFAVTPGPVSQPSAAAETVPVFKLNGRPAGNRHVVLRTGMPTLTRANGSVIAVVPYGLNWLGRGRHTAVAIKPTDDGRSNYRVDPSVSASRRSSSSVKWYHKVSLRDVMTVLTSVLVSLVLLLIFQPQVYLAHFSPRDRGLAATSIVLLVLWFVAVIAHKIGKRRTRDYDNI